MIVIEECAECYHAFPELYGHAKDCPAVRRHLEEAAELLRMVCANRRITSKVGRDAWDGLCAEQLAALDEWYERDTPPTSES